MMLLSVCFGESICGRENIATNGGLLPKCTVELNKAKFDKFRLSKVPINEACFTPIMELTKFAR